MADKHSHHENRSHQSHHGGGDSYQLDVSSYDRAASLLIALLVLVGVFVLGLVIVYFSIRVFQNFTPQEIVPTEIAGRGEAAMGFEDDIEPPGEDEAPELIEPELTETLNVLAEVSTKLARLDDSAITGSNVATKGSGQGDRRRAGPRGVGADERVPREERWRINYTNSQGIDAYAQQLDFFGIELGAYDSTSRSVDYASNLSQPTPTRRQGLANQDTRLYMFYQGGTLLRFDTQLLQKAGISTQRKRLIQFYPKPVEGILENLERLHMEKEVPYDVNKINRTIFGVNQRGAEYEYYVISQLRI